MTTDAEKYDQATTVRNQRLLDRIASMDKEVIITIFEIARWLDKQGCVDDAISYYRILVSSIIPGREFDHT